MQNSKKFGIKNYLYVSPWLIMLFVSTLTINNQTEYVVQAEHNAYGKMLVIFTFTLSLTLLFFRFNKVFSILQKRWLYILFMLYTTASTVWSADPMSTLRISAYYWGAMVVCLTAAMAFREDQRKFFQALIFYSAVMTCGSLFLVLLNPARGIDNGGRWIGLTSHPNVLGIVSIITVWSNISYLFLTKSRRMKILNAAMLILAAICLYGANSVTSIVLSVAIVVLTLILRSFDAKKSSRVLVELIGLSFVVFVGIFVLYLVKPDMFRVDALFGLIGRNPTFTGRTNLWALAMSSIYHKPIMGSGFQEYILISGDKIKHFHDGYIDLLIRGGIVALIFLIMFIFQFFMSAKRIGDQKLFLFFSIMMFTIIMHNITEGSFGRGLTTLWLVFSFIYFYKSNDDNVRIPAPQRRISSDSHRRTELESGPRFHLIRGAGPRSVLGRRRK